MLPNPNKLQNPINLKNKVLQDYVLKCIKLRDCVDNGKDDPFVEPAWYTGFIAGCNKCIEVLQKGIVK